METQSDVRFPATWGGLRPALQRRIDDTLAEMRQRAGLGLHLGAGAVRIPGLLNCDLYDEAAEERVDCLNLSQYADGTVDHIETHHMLEHLDYDEVDRALKEWHRALRPGGKLVLTCPDVTRVAMRWVLLSLWPFRAVANRNGKRAYALKMLYGPQSAPGMVHKSGHDRHTLRSMLGSHGFDVEFSFTPYPRRPTPSLLVVASKR